MRAFQPMPAPTTAGAKNEAPGILLPRADQRRQELNQWQHQADVSVNDHCRALACSPPASLDSLVF
jgi:hypothetical protein